MPINDNDYYIQRRLGPSKLQAAIPSINHSKHIYIAPSIQIQVMFSGAWSQENTLENSLTILSFLLKVLKFEIVFYVSGKYVPKFRLNR